MQLSSQNLGSVMRVVSVLHLSGVGDSEAESERGERETAGPARAFQEVFDTTQRSLGQGASQRAHAEVTSDTRFSDRHASASEGTVTRPRWTGARPLSALEVLEGANPCLVTFLASQLCYLTGSRFN